MPKASNLNIKQVNNLDASCQKETKTNMFIQQKQKLKKISTEIKV